MRKAVMVSLAMWAMPALAQQQATLDEIRVEGVPNLLKSRIISELSFSEGDPLSKINPKLAEISLMNVGFFKSIAAELLQEGSKNILRIRAEANPDITAVEVKGTEVLDADLILKALAGAPYFITKGVTLNTARVDTSRALLENVYQQTGLPFAPKITSDIVYTDTSTTVVYTIEENVDIKSLKVEGNTLVDSKAIEKAMGDLLAAGKFTLPAYQQGIQSIVGLYADRGYGIFTATGYVGSAVALDKARLQDGVLTLPIREMKIGSIDSKVLGEGATLTFKTGDVLNVKTVQNELKPFSQKANAYINASYSINPETPDVVDISLQKSDQAAGRIETIVVNGETVLPENDILNTLSVKQGDFFDLTTVQNDYLVLQRAYRRQGYELATQPNPIGFDGKTLTITMQELRIGGYEIRWDGAHSLSDRFVTRELPAVGSAFNQDVFRKNVEKLLRTGMVDSPQLSTKISPDDQNEVIFILTLKEVSSRYFAPALEYSTDKSWSGGIDYNDTNLLGTGHTLTANFSASLNDAGQIFGGQLRYSIPWLDIDFADFRTVATGVGAGVYSTVTPNNPIVTSDNVKVGREYSERATGFNASIARPFGENIRVSLGVNVERIQNYLEAKTAGETGPDNDGDTLITTHFPPEAFTTSLSTGIAFDKVNYPDFPTSGVRWNTNALYGFGRQGDSGLSWWQLSGGARTYFGFGPKADNGNTRFALGVRANAGTLLGSTPKSRPFRIGGSEPSDTYTLRGYDAGAFTGNNFLTTSAELRYDLGVTGGFSQGLYAIGFVDAGDAWNDVKDFNWNVGYGVGIQLNLGNGGFILPAIRFDYAFNPNTSAGKFVFRLGSFF